MVRAHDPTNRKVTNIYGEVTQTSRTSRNTLTSVWAKGELGAVEV